MQQRACIACWRKQASAVKVQLEALRYSVCVSYRTAVSQMLTGCFWADDDLDKSCQLMSRRMLKLSCT